MTEQEFPVIEDADAEDVVLVEEIVASGDDAVESDADEGDDEAEDAEDGDEDADAEDGDEDEGEAEEAA